MEHVLTVNHNGIVQLSVIEKNDNSCIVKVENLNADNFEQIYLTKEQLHSFIGTLLHVQQKMKGGK